jgi:hypothetical protein
MPFPGSGFAHCVGDAELENDRAGDVSELVGGRAMCRALRYVSAFLKLDRCVVVSHLGEPHEGYTLSDQWDHFDGFEDRSECK